MRVVTFILAVVACVGVVYNYIQLQQMRQQLMQVRLEVARLQSRSEPANVTLARKHLQRAQQLLNEGKFLEASKELEQGARAIAETSSSGSNGSWQQLHQLIDEARKEIARFWSGNRETKP